MVESRIFLGNLPPNVSETDLQGKLKRLGKLFDVTIKQRTDHEGRVTSTFAHCSISSEDVNKCLDKFMKCPWNGHSVKAEIAKKSAQQRLQESKRPEQQQHVSVQKVEPLPAEQPRKTRANVKKASENQEKLPAPKKKSFDESSDSEEEVFWKQNGSKTENTVKMDVEEPNPKRRRREEEQPTKLYMAKSTSAQSDLLRRMEKFSSVWGDDNDTPYAYSTRHRNQEARGGRDNNFGYEGRDDNYGNGGRDNSYGGQQDFSSKYPPRNNDTTSKDSESVTKIKPEVNGVKKEKKKDKEKEKDKIGSKNDKKMRSEEKRLQSLNEKADNFMKQQMLVKKALAGDGPKNKKIKFDEDENGDELVASKSKSVSLFENDSDDDNEGTTNHFKIKKQFEGKKGEKLLELQSTFGMDERFKLDSRFAETDEKVHSDNEEADTEVSRQLSIIDSIVGPSGKGAGSKNKMDPIVRYDPSKVDHGQKYKLQKKVKEVIEEEVNETPLPEVSSERYFEVKSDLKSILKPDQEKGFSLRNMFGGNDEGSDNEQEKTKRSKTKEISQKRLVRNPLEREDSSDESGVEDHQEKNDSSARFSNVVSGPFFFKIGDARFEEGQDFLKKATTLSGVEFKAKRQELQTTLKNKIRKVKNKKTTFAKKLGGKPKNRFGKEHKRK